MSRKPGLSAEEKRKKMLEIFHETKDVFQLKDIEKLAPSAKGITLQSVKNTIQELVDDDLVQCGKIGTNMYYWSFPSKAINDLKRKVKELEKKNEEVDSKCKALVEGNASSKIDEKSMEQINALQLRIKELEDKKNELQKEVASLEKGNSLSVEQKSAEIKKAHEAANRWTDNIFATKSWCKKKFGLEEKDIDKNFNIPEDFDYLPDE